MKTAIKLVLIYFAMQIIGVFVVGPLARGYAYIEYGSVERAGELAAAPTLLAGIILMSIYLWKQGYLTNDKRLYSFVSASYLFWSAIMGISMIYLVDYLMSHLSFLPDWYKNTFDILQSGWLGIACVAILGPILEELLFRGAITKVLLKKYNPVTAILVSGLIFGIFHVNPAQVVGAILIGFVLAWIYYRTRSLIPCILIHIMNNSLSVYLSLKFPDVDSCSELIGENVYLIGLIVAVVLLLLSWRMMNTYKLSNTTTEI